MKITRTRTHLVELPADEPLAGAAEGIDAFLAKRAPVWHDR